ncbi:hypothetical protein JW916_04385, partial [Candidatus Sumerlaeota bacterium]|nr:hypothetical protein [Candidatus Sumerlaeota bacterium]
TPFAHDIFVLCFQYRDEDRAFLFWTRVGEILYEKIWAICIDRLPALIAQLEAIGVENAPKPEEP